MSIDYNTIMTSSSEQVEDYINKMILPINRN